MFYFAAIATTILSVSNTKRPFISHCIFATAFFLNGGDTTYILVTTRLTIKEARDYCIANFNGQLAPVTTEEQLQKVNKIIPQGYGLEGFLEPGVVAGMWVDGLTDAPNHEYVDVNTVGAGKMLYLLRTYIYIKLIYISNLYKTQK